MLYDYFSVNRQELPPERLKYLWRKVRSSRPEGVKGEPRCIGDRVYYFRYERKDPVTGVYQEDKE